MFAAKIIAKKRDKLALTSEEIEFMVQGYTRGQIADYQMSAFLMALYIQGMTREETVNMAKVIAASGQTIDLSNVPGVKVDKHSTGGVGDKTSLVLVPLVAAAGVPILKLSGRGLGHTGGTLDKLESIPGYEIHRPLNVLIEQVRRIGLALAAAGEDIVPADKKMYALRDVTATVSSIPLISSSIMGKKAACGADKVILDVKTGSGAFSKTMKDARELAEALVSVGEALGQETVAVISDMNQPLGFTVGNSLEVKEAIHTLKGEGPRDLEEVCLTLGSLMVFLGERASNLENARDLLRTKIASGEGLEKLRELISAQGGDPQVIDDPSLLPRASFVEALSADKDGRILAIDTKAVGEAALLLGAGRLRKEDTIDHAVGMVFSKKLNDFVRTGEALAEVHGNEKTKIAEAKTALGRAITIADAQPALNRLVHATIPEGVIRDEL